MSWVEDRLQILNLISSYAYFRDSPDAEAFADCFTDDGVFIMKTGSPQEVRVEGRDALLAFHEKYNGSGPSKFRHLQTSTFVTEQDAVTARATTSMIAVLRDGDRLPVAGTGGLYEDELVKTVHGWRISVRRKI